MLFTTFDFLVFALPVLLVSWALRGRALARTLFLLGASYLFYMGGPKTSPPPTPWYYAGLLVASTLLDYFVAIGMERARARGARGAANALLGLSLAGNLGVLGYFKYTNFLAGVGVDLARAIGFDASFTPLKLLLPVGISFYTFQTLSYSIDVWRGQLAAQRNFPRFALFVVLFPQLVAGPIVRASELLPQLERPPRFSAQRLDEAAYRILRGLVKKVLFGDYVAAHFTDLVFAAPSTYTSVENLFALYAFTLQLYADFSGYSDIAIGVAKLLGYDLPENFDRPHQAKSVGEFWRRWHMTLSTWLRDYLFFPLGGSKGSNLRTYFNLWLTMFLVGMWHGASWNFVLYSNLQGAAMLFNRWNRLRDRDALSPWFLAAMVALAAATMAMALQIFGLPLMGAGVLTSVVVGATLLVTALPETPNSRVNTAMHVLLTFQFTAVTRLFFRAESWEDAMDMLAKLVALEPHGVRPGLIEPGVAVLLLFGLAMHFTPKRLIDGDLYRAWSRVPAFARGVVFAAVCAGLMTLMSGAPRAFIYFQF